MDDEGGPLRAKVLLIGLDGATPDLIEEFRPKMPFLSKLLSRSAWGTLRTFYPTLSPMEWCSLFTGKNPAKTGVFYLYSLSKGDLRTGAPLANLSQVGQPTLWEVLNLYGLRTGVVNVPCTYPPRPLDGFMISGFLAPRARGAYYYPPEVGEVLREYGYEVDLDFEKVGIGPSTDSRAVDKRRVLEEQERITEARVKVALELARRYQVDFLFIIIKGTDNIQHLFWTDKRALGAYYAFVDGEIEELYEGYGPTHLIVVSDHGFHEKEARYFHLNTWLYRKGYLRAKNPIKFFFKTAFYNLAYLIMRFLRPLLSLLPEGWEMEAYKMPDWIDTGRSLAYGLECGIFLSDRVREDPSLYGRLREELRRELLNLRVGGEEVFKAVYLREELFSGRYLSKIPDLILVPNPRFAVNPHPGLRLAVDLAHKPYLTGAHKADNKAFFLLAGEGVRAGPAELRITDIMPLVLYIYGLPIPSGVDGRAPLELFEEGFRRPRPLRYVPEEKLKLRIRLRSLGLR